MMIDFGIEPSLSVVIIGLVCSAIGSIITIVVANITSKPDLIRVSGEWIDRAEVRITKLEKKQEELEKEISGWKRNYFKLLAWLKDFFRKNGIDVVIPEFHKESES